MRAIMVMFDSLNRRFLPNYGCDWVKAPNFLRLADKAVTFQNSYVGSLPCMPARRELHTGRLNFLHRGWGPLEPFDDSMPELLKEHGVYTHLVSDHQHYWEDGGATYHTRYSSWEQNRGQEGDPWIADLNPEIRPQTLVEEDGFQPRGFSGNFHRQDAVNRAHMPREEDRPQARTFQGGLRFLERNHSYDNWFLQIETFDPHEPFFSCEKYESLYPKVDVGREMDWPPYAPCGSSEEVVRHVRNKYAALVSMCDHYLGKVLDFMDSHDMWKDTLLIVNTDHGYLLGEHEWWSKSIMPLYNGIAQTPLFIWDPRSGVKGERRQALVQTIDLAPTILDFFNVEIPKDMLGKPLKETVATDQKVRDYAIFGHHGCHINITDGRYVYMKSPLNRENEPLYEYTLMPTRMRRRFLPGELKDAALHDPFSFTKDCPVLQLPTQDDQGRAFSFYRYGTRLYDLQNDPEQNHPIDDPETELRLINAMAAVMAENDAPEEQYIRMGVPKEGMTMEKLLAQRACQEENDGKVPVEGFAWSREAREQFYALAQVLERPDLSAAMGDYLRKRDISSVDRGEVEDFAREILPAGMLPPVLHMLNTAAKLF